MSAADSSSPSAPALNVVLDSLIPADDPGRVPEPDEVYLAFSEWAESTRVADRKSVVRERV